MTELANISVEPKKIIGLRNLDLSDYLTITHRVVSPPESDLLASMTADHYEPDAILPDGRWLELTQTDRIKYVADRSDNASTALGLARLTRFDFGFAKRFSRTYTGSKLMPELTRKLRTTVSRYVAIRSEFEVLGVFRSGAGFYSVTRSKTKQFLGLHVDSWDGTELDGRESSRQRICINLGPGTRYFWYCPLNVIEDATKSEWSRRAKFTRATPLARAWLTRMNQAPIMRVRLEPGFAYLAPTDNLVHDGSTQGEEASETLVCFAQFDPSK